MPNWTKEQDDRLRGVPLIDLSVGGCRYPVTDGPPHLFCDQPQTGGSSYCRHHHYICHVAPRVSQEAA